MREHITILHVSDMQFGRNHKFGRLGENDDPDAAFDTLFQRLDDDLTLLEQSNGLIPDIVVISGDLAEWGKKEEFQDALDFLVKLKVRLALNENRFVIVPGNHDINRKLAESYVAGCEGEGEPAKQPYWVKWKHYHHLLQQFYTKTPSLIFNESQPWTLYEIQDLRIAIAAFNSTILESHLDNTHYGWIGEGQMRWFVDPLRKLQERNWFRLGVVHHNVLRGAVDDEENLHDAEPFKRRLGPFVNMILHGHTHKDDLGWADSNVPIISTGSAALKTDTLPEGVSNQYQFVRIASNYFTRWTRCYDSRHKRWIGDNSCSIDGQNWHFHKPLLFSNVHSTFPPPDPDKGSDATPPSNEPPTARIVDFEKPVTVIDANQKLANVPRFLLKAENQHRLVRQTEQERLAAILTASRVCWLVTDWGMGKEGFLACALEQYQRNSLTNVYRLQCGGVKSTDELILEAELQLGMSFIEFLASISVIATAVLVLDDLPHVIAAGEERARFEQRIRPLFDFCPDLRIIYVTRFEPKFTSPDDIVLLRALDAPQTREYLKAHPKTRLGLIDAHELERIHDWSGGLPMHLDRLLERLHHVTLTEILNEDVDIPSESTIESVPVSLKSSITELLGGTTALERQSMRLLKVLTVLRDGETLQSIRYFYRENPFNINHIERLVGLALLEDVPISQTIVDFTSTRFNRSLSTSEPKKLLRVPRQVRDYVNTLITNEDRDEIVRTSTGLFFGTKWSLGIIKPRRTIDAAYAKSAIAGPGNEHLIVRYLLGKALSRGLKQQIERYAGLANSYSQKLLIADRFRDVLISSGAVVELLKNSTFDEHYVRACYLQGRALRMLGREAEAVNILEEALERGQSFLTKDQRGDFQLSLALAHQDLNHKEDAIAAANKCLEEVHDESSPAFQAKAAIAELILIGNERNTELKKLEDRARNKKHEHAANNIALELARNCKNPDDALFWLKKVMVSAKDNYTKSRAVIDKANTLSKHLRISELSDLDRNLLYAAYSYSYAQRIGNLLDRCHVLLWGLFMRDKLWASILRLFRFSSISWLLRETTEKEGQYLDELGSIDLNYVEHTEGQALKNEILYLERRRHSRPPL